MYIYLSIYPSTHSSIIYVFMNKIQSYLLVFLVWLINYLWKLFWNKILLKISYSKMKSLENVSQSDSIPKKAKACVNIFFILSVNPLYCSTRLTMKHLITVRWWDIKFSWGSEKGGDLTSSWGVQKWAWIRQCRDCNDYFNDYC